MCGLHLDDAVKSLVGAGVNLAKNLIAPSVPNPGQPPAVTAPPGQAQATGTAAPAQAAQRPQNSAGSLAPGAAGSTLLTGGQGVAPSMLTLGRNTLLGQ